MQFVHRTDNFKIANIKNIILASNLPINLNRILFKEAGNIEFIFPLVSPFIIVEESNLQRFSHSLGGFVSARILFIYAPSLVLTHVTINNI